ncbi:ABC transporter ATP-binding protein [Streptomyces bacillaris]|uniref:ABC transporter ATP-binding protein n=1 Tax=Streptomyces TaxID=1883 RepID=UPI00200EE869|nr:ABC transporter ATP-binding protein [Streptomyces sp. HNA39]UQA37520.1 ABC transporter ATP-binding protein/permease [Streptomyces sp. HNA39]
MIRSLFALLDPPGRRRLRALLIRVGAAAVLQGLAGCTLIPLLGALFSDDRDAVWTWAAVLAGLVLAHHAVLLRNHRHAGELSSALLRLLHTRLGEALTRIPLGWFAEGRAATVNRLVTKTALDVATAPAHLVAPVVAAVVTPATIVVVTLAVQWQVGLALLLGAPLPLLAYRLYLRVIERVESTWEAGTNRASERVLEYARQQPVLRAYGGGAPLDRALTDQDAGARSMVLGNSAATAPLFLALQTVLTAVLALTVMLALGGEGDIGVLIAVMVLAVRFVEPLTAVAEVAGGLRIAAVGLRRFREVLDTPPLPEPDRPAAPGPPSVEFREVDFGYTRDRPVLRALSFRAEPGTLTALVGPSGAGKSTVLSLIARFHDADSGAVLVGDRDVRELGTEQLLSHIALVSQHPYLFEESITENILRARPGAGPDELDRVVRLARVDEIAARLPDGLGTRVGEGGATLSGGERQRVSIARALLKDAPIVLLDEVTSSLDAVNERLVQQAVTRLAADRTVLVVAHRLETVENADHILVLDGGRITESGSHEELLRLDGVYSRFVDCRRQAAAWRLTSAG